MRIVKLKGDYTGKRLERQTQAKESKCDIVLSFHFNASLSPNAAGAEVYYNRKRGAKEIAEKLLSVIVSILNVPNRGAKPSAGTRAAFIENYHCPTVLLEPLFITNPSEARLVHDLPTIQRLARAIAKTVFGRFKCIGIDVGHKFKTSNPNDRGARCVFSQGCTEAFHAELLADMTISELRTLAKQQEGTSK